MFSGWVVPRDTGLNNFVSLAGSESDIIFFVLSQRASCGRRHPIDVGGSKFLSGIEQANELSLVFSVDPGQSSLLLANWVARNTIIAIMGIYFIAED